MGTTKVCGSWHADCPDKWRTCQIYVDGIYVETITEYKPNPACDGNGDGNDNDYCSILGDNYVETYLGCTICYSTRIVGGAYYSNCVEVFHSKKADAKKDICEQQDGVWDGTTCDLEIVPYWKHHSTYREIDIDVWYPYGTPYRAYFDGEWNEEDYLSTLKAAIDDFLEPEPEPEAYIFEIFYWVEGMATWGTIWSDPTGPVPVEPPDYSSRPAKVGEEMYLGVWWYNTGNVAVTGQVDLELTAPSGAKHVLSASSGQDETQGPNSGAAVVFNPFTLNEAGTWGLKATLSHAGDTLDEETTSFPVEVPAKIPTIISITISPKTGAPPYNTRIEGELYGEDGSWLAFATVNLYRDEEWIDSTSTSAAGLYSFTQVITEPHDFYTEFEGNDKYEGCA